MTIKDLVEKLIDLHVSPNTEIRIAYDGGYADCGIEDVFVFDETHKISHLTKSDFGIVIIRTNQ